MKLSTLLILFRAGIAASVNDNEVNYYGTVIKDVHTKYESSGVIIASSTNHLSIEKFTIWHDVIKKLSDEGISPIMINFRKLEGRLKVHVKRSHHPLIVIVLDTMEELHSFESITKRLDISSAVWLMLFSRDASQDVCKYCRNPHRNSFNLKFDSKVFISCCDSNMIEEWWSLEKNRTKRQEVGQLTNGNLKIVWFSNKAIHDRRRSMDGRSLRIAAVKGTAFFVEKGEDYDGFCGEILKELSRAMNFTISEIVWKDEYGSWNGETSTWTGVIGMIERQEADIAFPVFLMSTERYDAVQFTSPITLGEFQVHFRKLDAAHLPFNAYFKVLAVDVWMAVIGLILTTPVLLTVIRYNKRKYNFFFLLLDHYLYVWGIYCQQGLPVFPNETPLKIIYVSLLLSALVASSTYSSAFISYLTAFSSDSPFTTIDQFVEDGTYGLIVLTNSAYYDLFRHSNNKLMNKMMSLMKPIDLLPHNYEEAFKQVCNDKVGFYTDESTKKSLANAIPCEIASIDTGNMASSAMIMPWNSEYVHVVNYHIQRFRSIGMFRRLEHKYFKKVQPDEVSHPPVHLEGIAIILFALAIGALAAFIVFIIEQNSSWFKKQLSNRKRRRTRRRSTPLLYPVYPYCD